MQKISILENQDVSYLDNILFENKLLKVVSSECLSKIPQMHLTILGHKKGIYCFPTLELADWLTQNFDINNMIEIGSGNGALARHLKIPATDSKLMQDSAISALYTLMGQPVTKYPDDVIKLDAIQAIEKYKPKTVLGCWVTHKYSEDDPDREGNMYGVDETWVLQHVDQYIIVGNENVHNKKKILEIPHQEYKFSWLFSRSQEPTKNIIYVWDKVYI